MFRKLAGKTLFVTGASRGIGKAIALKAARDGANIVIAAKTAEPHPKLPGTIYTAAKECTRCSCQLVTYNKLHSLKTFLSFSLEGRTGANSSSISYPPYPPLFRVAKRNTPNPHKWLPRPFKR